jgi:hypothetical protein
VSRPKTRHSKSSRYKHAVLHLLECASLALSIQDFGTFKGIVKLTHYVTIFGNFLQKYRTIEHLERFQPDWKRFNSNFASNFIDLTSLRYFQSA